MISLEGSSKEELTKAFRDIFKRLDITSQTREYMRLDRIINDKPVLIVEPMDEIDRRYKFQTVEQFIIWLRKNGYPNADPSNVYKCMRGERKSAYGHTISIKKETL